MKDKAKIMTLYVLVAVAILLIVGAMDFEDEAVAEAHYCDMVINGHWPHYKSGVDCN